MTLVEMTVALALLSLLSVGILTSFRIGERSWHKISTAVGDDRDLLTTQHFLRRILESAYPFEPSRGARTPAFGLEGTATDLTLTAPMPQGAGTGGYYRYHLALEETGQGSQNLIVRWTLDRNGLVEMPQQPGTGTEDLHREILIERLQSLEWSYLAPADGSADTGQTHWRSSWTEHRKLPALVRLRISFAPEDNRHWPDLLVAPRITDDARCQFDVVSQTCRETSG
jgi:general secretion pathway protein J